MKIRPLSFILLLNLLVVAACHELDDIIPNRFQPRLAFDNDSLQELSDSIKVHGIIQPLVLRRVGDKYEIIAGERRYRASLLAGKETIPAIVRDFTDDEMMEINIQEIQNLWNTKNENIQNVDSIDKKIKQNEEAIKLLTSQINLKHQNLDKLNEQLKQCQNQKNEIIISTNETDIQNKIQELDNEINTKMDERNSLQNEHDNNVQLRKILLEKKQQLDLKIQERMTNYNC